MLQSVEMVTHIGGVPIHRFQVVRDRRRDGDQTEWIVVDFEGETVTLATPDFTESRSVPRKAFRDGTVTPLAAEGVPVWGY